MDQSDRLICEIVYINTRGVTNINEWYELIDYIDSLLAYDPDQILSSFLRKVSSDRNKNLEKVLGKRGKINQIGELIYKYMDVIKPETLFRLTFLLPEELWGIKFLLEYKPDLIEEYLDIYPDHISLLIELNLHGYPEYHELIEKYAKKYHYFRKKS